MRSLYVGSQWGFACLLVSWRHRQAEPHVSRSLTKETQTENFPFLSDLVVGVPQLASKHASKHLLQIPISSVFAIRC